jgi:hypothetical protein
MTDKICFISTDEILVCGLPSFEITCRMKKMIFGVNGDMTAGFNMFPLIIRITAQLKYSIQ